MFCLVLNDIVSWKGLKYVEHYQSKKYLKVIGNKYKTIQEYKNCNFDEKYNDLKDDYHWKSIKNEFSKWSDDNIFMEAHNTFLRKNYYKMKPHLSKASINLYIDITSCWNKYGIEEIGINPELKKKNVTRYAELVDDDGDMISIMHMKMHKTDVFDDNEKLKYVKKTFSHDISMVQKLFDNVIIHFDGRKNVYCGGDKAFKTQNEFYINNKKVRMITPQKSRSDKQKLKLTKKKKNEIARLNEKLLTITEGTLRYLNCFAKIKSLEEEIKIINKKTEHNYTKKEKEILGNRNVVERNFCDTKKNERIALRKDHRIIDFMSFVYIANLKILTNKYGDTLDDPFN
jgi:hypothetical protein